MKNTKRISILFVTLLLIVMAVSAIVPQMQTVYAEKNVVNKAISWKMNEYNSSYLFDEKMLNESQSLQDWYFLIIASNNINDNYYGYYHNMSQRLKTEELFSKLSSSDKFRMALALASAGWSAEKVGEINLLKESIFENNSLGDGGVMELAYALLALDSRNYAVPNNSVNTKDSIIDEILTYQLPNGGYTWLGGVDSDVDITAIVLTALAKYNSLDKVKESITKSKEHLYTRQNEDGFMQGWENASSLESTAQTIIAFASLGIDVKTDSNLIKNNKNIYDLVLSCQAENGGFESYGYVNDFATQQSLMAITAYNKSKNGFRFFDFSLTSDKGTIPFTSVDELMLLEYSKNIYSGLVPALLVFKERLLNTPAYEGYKKCLDFIDSILEKIKGINEEINKINYEIEMLYKNEIGINTKKQLLNLIERSDSLHSTDKMRITKYEKLINDYESIKKKNMVVIICSISIIICLGAIITLVVINRKKSSNK